ncbi:MAG: bacteriohemerythrin [Pseudomonadales bacterium]|nr:bacteriohemerythrin [Pseudomonadales bacterium]
MKTINWTKQLSVGIDAIDDDHKALFAIIEQYRLAISSDDLSPPILLLFEKLQDYVHFHFSREEAILRKTNYPGTAKHIEAHHLFASELNRFKQLYSDLPSLFPHEAMLAFLNEWLINHISTDDNDYIAHLENHQSTVSEMLAENDPGLNIYTTEKSAFKQPKLRVLDDEYGIGQLICNVGDSLGFDTQSYQRASQFYKNYEEDTDTIILDLHMPDIDGIEVIRDLARRKCQASIILISGFDGSVLHSAEELAVEQELNLKGSLTKPFRIIELHELLKSRIEESGQNKVVPQQKNKAFLPEDIRKAIKNDEFKAYYQPQLALVDQALVGVEVLCRWIHPKLGIISPAHFIPIAEQHDLIDALTWKILTQAIKQAKVWQNHGIDIQISVNMPASMFNMLDLPEKIFALMLEHQIKPQKLVLEVTESIVMDEQVKALDSLTRLRLKGFQISIDDFGTGYSSMLQLHRIPFSEIKVDQSFILKMQTDTEAQAIAETVIMLGHKLGLTVVAEGIENAATLSQLKLLNCEVGQGFHFAKAMSATHFYDWVMQDKKDNLPGFHLLTA